MNKILRGFLQILLVFFLSLWTVKPLFISGFFPVHDDTQPARIYEMAKALQEGQFPVRWVNDLGYGYGYPLFNFYAPLPYYIGGIFNLSGIDAINSAKIMYVIGVLAAGLCMFFLLREFSGEISAVTGAVLYLYAPYHAVNIYVRGAVGEYYAYAFLPLIILGIYKILTASPNQSGSGEKKGINSDYKKGILITSLSFAAILLSHNILGLITGYYLALIVLSYLVYLSVRKKNLMKILIIIYSLSLGAGLAFFFVLPALSESKYTKVDRLVTSGSDFHNHFVYLDQLWNSPWGYGGSGPDRNDGMSFKIGKIYLLLGLLGLLLIIIKKEKEKDDKLKKNFSLIISVVFLTSVYFTIQQSQPLWEIIPGFAFIQYPWRFLNITVLSLVLIGSGIYTCISGYRLQLILSVLTIGFVLWSQVKYFQPKTITPSVETDYISSFNLRNKISSISDEYLPRDFRLNPNGNSFIGLPQTENLKVLQSDEKSTVKSYSVMVNSPEKITANITFFPGWQVYIDQKVTRVSEDHGKITFLIDSGRHLIEIKFGNTPLRYLANAISLLSLFLLVYESLFQGESLIWRKRIR